MEEITPAQSPKRSPLGWIAFVIIVLVLGAASFSALQNNPQNNNQNQPLTPSPSATALRPISPHTLVFGSWEGDRSVITALDLSTHRSSTIASLPVSIKKVSVVSPTTILYVDETNRRDHGKRLVLYNIKEKTKVAEIPADNGFGIDDYIVSPNKRFVAVWEVSFAEGSEILQGGRSRVYAVDLTNPSAKNLLFDELSGADNPINYPRAILNDGKVFTDKFLPNDPNSGMGWAYGMSVVDFNGGNKRDVDSMTQGTYGTQPFLSPNGQSLVFAGYDGSLGNGNTLRGGIRQALLTPNTVELLDTTTLQRRKLSNLPNSNIYSSAFWDNLEGNLTVTLLSKTAGESGLFSYNIASGSLKKIEIPESPQDPYAFISNLTSDITLLGKADNSRASLGNLGEEYAASLTAIYAQDSVSGNLYDIRLDNSLAQYITVLPASYFQNVLGIAHAQGGNPINPNVTIIDFYSDKPSQENLQLKTFLMKPELAPIREKQQSTPVNPPLLDKRTSCRDLATEQCLAQGYEENSREFRECHNKAWDANRATKGTPEAVCNKSPLYVYGEPGQSINVVIQTLIYNDSPAYNNGYDITVTENDGMIINGKTYESVKYDYSSNLRKITAPTRGVVVSKTNVEKTLREFSKKIGLNKKETNDLVGKGKAVSTSPYVFISFFDHATSHSILPLVFTPEPDNYLNVVFYFKLLNEKPNYTPLPPLFGKSFDRSGLSVVEVSEIVE
jgi:hypothetical protein